MKNPIPLIIVLFQFLSTFSNAQEKEFFLRPKISLELLGTYETGIFDEAAAEIAAYSARHELLYVTNADEKSLDILDISDPTNPSLVKKVDLMAGPNSVDVHRNLVAVALENDDTQLNGRVLFLNYMGTPIKEIEVGALPDMLTFTPNGKYVLVANEAEPNDDYTIDPEGSVSIINIKTMEVKTVEFTSFNDKKDELKAMGVRIFGPNATVAQDLEPEFITVDDDSETAWVVFQENNAMAKINIKTSTVENLFALGFKNHALKRNGIDASNDDDAINIRPWPVKGMYQPDAISNYSVLGFNFLVTANEGDARDYDEFSEEVRVGEEDDEGNKLVLLDPETFPNSEMLQMDENLGRLKITNTLGDTDGDGDFDELYSYGARSFSIWTGDGKLVYDSGNDFEKITSKELPNDFNSTNDENDSFDNRSDDKGPEPEGLDLGKIFGRTYAFIGLERVGGIMIYDITNPLNPRFVHYSNNRDFQGDAEAGTAGDLGPEGILFIPRWKSPINHPMLVVTNEVSGTTSIFKIKLKLPFNTVNPNLEIKAYPNPVVRKIFIDFNQSYEGLVNIELTGTMNGTSYLEQTGKIGEDKSNIELDLSHLPKNMYVMKVSYGTVVKHFNIVKN